MMPPTSIDGTDITGASIDGQDVEEITVDGDTVFSAGPQVPDAGNLIFHLDASQESLSNNQTTSTITDFSGNNNDATGDSVTFSTNEINGLPAFIFNEDILTANASYSNPLTLGIVHRVDVNNKEARIIGDLTSASDFNFARDTGQFGNGTFVRYGGGNVDANFGDDFTFETSVMKFDGGNSEYRLNGTQLSSGSTGNYSASAFNIGNGGGGATRKGLEGAIAEILFYNNATNISNLEAYLSNKYGTF